ncbi:MAG: murein biosynthesis integral membrane protein MurJ [Phototrophicales bacterium]|nr:MAG: murein biosynthesis integral membrane protein MurJ [Phototrophicales bacterium]
MPNTSQNDVPKKDVLDHAAPLSPRRILRSVLVVMFGFGLTKLISLGQVLIIANRFGARADYDSFVAANTAPARLVTLIAGGALTVAFIPVFSGLLNRRDGEGAWRLASQVFNTLLVITITLSILIALFAHPLIEYVIAPGFTDAAQIEQSANLMRILTISTVLFALSGLISGTLNGHNHFFLPVLAPIFQDIGLLLGVIFLTGEEQLGIYGLAWGTVLGAVLHLSIQIPGLFMFKARWFPTLGWKDPRLHEVIRLMLPRMLASGVFIINILAINNIASRLGEGALSAFDWGLRIMDIPEALIGTAIGFVIFPTLAAMTELKQENERRQLFSEAVRFIFVATIPAAAGMLLIGRPATDILFVDNQEADLVYASVQVFALALVFQAVHEVVARAFYAQKDTFIPLLVSIAGMIGAVLGMVIAYNVYLQSDWPLASPFVVGIPAMGYLISFIIELGLLTYILKQRWQDLDEARVIQAILRTLAATVLMAIPVLIIDNLLTEMWLGERTRLTGLIRVGIGSTAGLIFFFIGAMLFNLQEVKRLPKLFRHRHESTLAIEGAGV